MQVGKIAHKYLSDYAAKQNVDKTFGIYKNPLDKLYYIGNTPIDIEDYNAVEDVCLSVCLSWYRCSVCICVYVCTTI